jgi:hypothetical protein
MCNTVFPFAAIGGQDKLKPASMLSVGGDRSLADAEPHYLLAGFPDG